MASPFQAQVGEINIVCSSLEVSLPFYRDVLGFQMLNEEQGCWHMALNGSRFLLLPFAQPSNTHHKYLSAPTNSVDLVVASLKEARAYFVDKGVGIEEDSQDSGCFFIRNPDGLVFEVVQAA